MKKLLIILSIVVVVTIIFFIPAIINLSSKIHLKKVQNSVTEKIDTTIKNVQNFKSDSKSESENNNEVIEELNNDSNENKLNDENENNLNSNNNETEVTFLSLNPLEEIEWLMQNIYIEDLDEERESVLNKDIAKIQWEHLKISSVRQTLSNIISSINKLLAEIPTSKILQPVESAKLRSLLISYSSSIEFVIKQGERNVSAKESLAMVIKNYNALSQYINNLQISAQIKGLELDFNTDEIKLEKFFENDSIKKIIASDNNFLTNSDIFLKRVSIKEENKKKTLNFDVEVSGIGITRVEVYNQYGLYESRDVNMSNTKNETRTLYFNKSYSAKGIYVIKVINGNGQYYYKRYLFYPRVTLFTLEHNEYKLPFAPQDYKKLDEFFEIKIVRKRMNSKFIDREFVTSF